MVWRQALRRLSGSGTRVGVFVDGPNVLRDDFDVDLDDIRARALRYGSLGELRLYLNTQAPSGLIKAAEARGFTVTVTSGDVDVRLATDATAAIATDTHGVVIFVTRDMDFKPVVEYARSRGLRTVALLPGEHGQSDALTNAVDEFAYLVETD